MTEYKTIEFLLNDPSTKWLAVLLLLTAGLTFLIAMVRRMLGAVIEIRNQWIKPSKEKDYSAQIKIEQVVSERIRFIKHDLRADRVSIYQYRNGKKSIANIPFLKLLITHETLSANAESIQINNKELSANVLGAWNVEIFTNQPIITPSLYSKAKSSTPPLSEDHELRSLYQLLKKNGTKSIYLFPMVNSDGITIGFGMVEYTREETMMDDYWINWSIVQFAGVGGLLASMADESPLINRG